MENLARKVGVEINKNATADEIVHHNKRVTGLKVNGSFVAGDYVLNGADVVYSYEKLLDGFENKARQLKKMEPSISGLVFLWGVKGEYPMLKHHNILFSHDYQSEFRQIFEEQTAPDDPTIYIAITSKKDRDHAPAGHENWFVLLNMPYITAQQDWNTIVKKMKQKVLEKLRSIGIELRDNIVVEKILTPIDFKELYFSNRGSIYGLSSNSRSAAFRRVSNRSRDVEGLFFASGSSHPGGGVPLVILAGKIASGLIQRYQR